MDTTGQNRPNQVAPDAELLELGDAFIELDRDWRILRVNRNQETLSRKPRRETVGRSFWDVFPDIAAPTTVYWREYHRCMEQRVAVQFDDHYAPLDMWTGVTAYPTSTGGIAIFFRDITQRKRTEEVVRAERDFNTAVLDTSASLIVVLDSDANIVRFSRACERLTGWSEPEVRGRSVFELFIPEDDLRGVVTTFAQLRVGDFPNQHRNRWRTKGGAERVIDWSNTAIADDRGRVKFIIGTGMDITERERTEKRIRALYEGDVIGLFYWTVEGGVTDANDKFLEMTGYTREDLRAGRIDWVKLTPPKWRHLDEHALANFKATGRSPPFEKEYLRKDGSPLPIIVGGTMLDDARREGVAFVVDITDRKHAEEALRVADERKTEFLGILSHELRNPLAPIRNAVYVLGRTEPGSPKAERARTIIARQVDHLTRLVDDLLEVRRITAGKLRLRTGPLDLVQQVRETVEDLRPLFVQHAVELELHAPAAAVHVMGDRTRIAQVLGNLLHNALKFTDPGGHVSVVVETRGGEAILRVRDTGVGIPPEMVPDVFEPFVQGERTLERNRGGLGLGLALVRGVIELHGGTVAAHSEGVGKGTEFIVTLPGTVEAPEARELSTATPGNAKRRVLVVEDNMDAAESLRDVLELLGGHEVRVVNDGRDGVEAARQYEPEVVVCDLGLPGLDGYEVARQIRANAPAGSARLVALSGYASAEDTERALRAGFDFHLAKPPDADRLLRLVADAPATPRTNLPGHLATGHHELDAHHASILAEAANLRAGVDAAAVWDSLRFLERHAIEDFQYEEDVMQDVQYPGLDSHRNDHGEFLNELRRLQERLRGGGPTPENVGAVADAVLRWLPDHVLDEDRRFTEFIQKERAASREPAVAEADKGTPR